MDSVKTVGAWSLQYTPPPSEWFYGHNASAILCPSAKGGERTILDMRGWGYLTGKGHGALGLDSETAAREQDALALFIIDACKAAASPAGAEVVARVKPLVWRDHKDGRYWIAETAFGEFAIQPYPAGYFATLNDGDIGISGATPDEVKSAVEADHTRRILSALEPTPSTDAVRRQAREEALEEALRLAAEILSDMATRGTISIDPSAEFGYFVEPRALEKIGNAIKAVPSIPSGGGDAA